MEYSAIRSYINHYFTWTKMENYGEDNYFTLTKVENYGGDNYSSQYYKSVN